jgi:hypothetical protein
LRRAQMMNSKRPPDKIGQDMGDGIMFKIIQGLPGNIVGLSATGTITDEDYSGTLIPLVEKAIREDGKVRMLMRFGPDFKGYTSGAMWDDTRFGLSHWGDFEKLAVVSDIAWIQNSVALFAPLIPAPVRVYGGSELEDAKRWIAE